MKKLKDLKNLGKAIIANLNMIGIYSTEDLEKIGAVGVYKKLTSRYPEKVWPVCYYLYSIEGALKNQHWDTIRNKQQLLEAVGKA